jgi:hypothetical protein
VEGYLALLTGQAVPRKRPWETPATELKRWSEHLDDYGRQAQQGVSVAEALSAIRRSAVTTRQEKSA